MTGDKAAAQLARADMIPRRLYRLRSRNLRLGVWDPEQKGFVGVREKLGSRYLAVEFHRENGPPLGTAVAVADLDVDVPPGIPLQAYFGSTCEACGLPVVWSGPPAPAAWVHWDAAAPEHEVSPMAASNRRLYEWLEAREREADEWDRA